MLTPLKRAAFAAFAGLVLATTARADTYPSRQVTIMPLLAAGTGLDVVVRLYADQLRRASASRWWSRTSRAARG
jgi:tripartite-type tricarboxylate transporter receptor subunit TctC